MSILLVLACAAPNVAPEWVEVHEGAGAQGDPPVASFGPPPAADADGDGWDHPSDCDDGDPAVNPGATEVCNGVDDDCDGRVDARDLGAEGVVRIWRDADRDGFGGAGPGRASCVVLPGWTTNPGDCDDGDPVVSPDGVEVCDNGIDEDCSGADDTCEAAVLGPSDASAALTNGANDLYNVIVADFTADGVDDVVSYGLVDDGTIDSWRFDGPLTGDVDTSAADRVWSTTPDFEYASAVYPVGDVDGDGLGDLLFALEYWTGELYLTSGGGAGERRITPITASATFVRAWRAQGEIDLDGDGTLDLLVGNSTGDPDAARYPGWVLGYTGPFAGTYDEGNATFIITPDGGGDGEDWGVGAAVTAVDIDGDGLDDPIVGASLAGNAYGFVGPLAGSVELGDATFEYRGRPQIGTGDSLATLDHNGDGWQDLVVAGSDKGGQLWLIEGPLASGVHALSAISAADVRGTVEDQGVGEVLRGGHDLDGDGADDLVAGIPRGSSSGPRTSAVMVFWGPLGGSGAPEDFPALRIEREGAAWADLGPDVDVGDVDADGLPDLVLTYSGGGLLTYLGAEGYW